MKIIVNKPRRMLMDTSVSLIGKVMAAVFPRKMKERVAPFEEFCGRFTFDEKRYGNLAVEVECFIVDKDGAVVPRAHDVLDQFGLAGWEQLKMEHPGDVAYRDHDSGIVAKNELSGCQLEINTRPCETVAELRQQLTYAYRQIAAMCSKLGLRPWYHEFGPKDMPLDVFPSERYHKIVKKWKRKRRLAACRVTATHIHVGMLNKTVALKVYNWLVQHCKQLCAMGDHSEGQRLAAFKETIYPQSRPEPYQDWQAFYATAVKRGFTVDIRQCWTLIRISKHGTIEFRMFGSTPSIDEIIGWAEHCRNLCMQAAVPQGMIM